MAKAYFTMLTFDGEFWGPDFGDFDRETVKDEAQERKDSGEKVRVIRCENDSLEALRNAMDKAGLARHPKL